jgi:radical SAM-linked protein
MQRLRIRFSRGEEVKFISHLDMMRMWQRVLQRADIPLAYSEGFNPHPRLALAAPLPVGVTAQSELMDIFCTRWVSPHTFIDTISRQLPSGIKALQAYPVPHTLPSLQASVSFAEYEVDLEMDKERKALESGINDLLALKSLPWEHQRDTGARTYDLRPLIDELRLIECAQGVCTIAMRLRCGSSGSGRPEQVAAALGFGGHPRSMRRIKLVLENT